MKSHRFAAMSEYCFVIVVQFKLDAVSLIS